MSTKPRWISAVEAVGGPEDAGFLGKDVSEFFAMGKFGGYVWFAYGVTLISLVLLFVWSWFAAKARDTELDQVRQWARAEKKTPSAVLKRTPIAESPVDQAAGHEADDYAGAKTPAPGQVAGAATASPTNE